MHSESKAFGRRHVISSLVSRHLPVIHPSQGAAVSGAGRLLPAWLFLAVAALAGCPDDGSGAEPTSPPAAPALELTPQGAKTFHFSWTDGEGEDEYRLLESADGESDYTPVATLPAGSESYDHVVFLPGRLNARYVLQACNKAGCADSTEVAVSGTLAEAIGYVKASNSREGDEFGAAVALSADGSTLAVGAPYEASGATGVNGDQSDDSTLMAGAVYVFTRDGAAWAQQAYVKPSKSVFGGRFGRALSLSADGDTLAVAAVGDDSGATGVNGDQNDESAFDSGAVYVFTRSDGEWSQQAFIKASNTDVGDGFGAALALSADGETLVVGAPHEASGATGVNSDQADNSAPDSGAVYLFTRSGATWSQQAYLKASNTDPGDFFGYSVAVSAGGDTLAVGAFGESSNAAGIDGDQADNSAEWSGAVYVFVRDPTSEGWSQQAYLKASNSDADDRFGARVVLSGDGDTLAAGAIGEDSGATGVNGEQDDDSSTSSGAIYVFTRSDGEWSQQAYLKASNQEPTDRLGTSIGLSANGDVLAAGTYWEDSGAVGIGGDEADNSVSDSGAVYLFSRTGGVWAQQAYIKASNPEVEDQFGYSMALSGDGETLAVGANYEDSGATGVGGDPADNSVEASGAVYLY